MLDVLIIGAGVVGALTARALSRHRLDLLVLDAATDTAMGTSKGNSGIVHAGFDARPGSLKAQLNLAGNRMMPDLAQELDVPLRMCGSLVVAFDDHETDVLAGLMERGRQNGVEQLELIRDAARLHDIEPLLSPAARAALLAGTGGIVCPYGLALAAMENAVANGASVQYSTSVEAVSDCPDGLVVHTTRGDFKTRCVVNAAGTHAARIGAMVGDSFSIHARRGEYLLLDRTCGTMARHVLFGTPTRAGKGILVSPTVDGNLLLGPTATPQDSLSDAPVTREGIQHIWDSARHMMPALRERDVITAFAGLRATSDTGDFIIRPSTGSPRLIHAAGIESPGLTAAPAIAELVLRMVAEAGVRMELNPAFNPVRSRLSRFHEADTRKKAQLIAQDPRHGHIVCRCETITEAEIVDAIHRPNGARDIDGVKRRVRAGSGRCQGGFCSPRVLQILSRELGVPATEIRRQGEGLFVTGFSKEGLYESDPKPDTKLAGEVQDDA